MIVQMNVIIVRMPKITNPQKASTSTTPKLVDITDPIVNMKKTKHNSPEPVIDFNY